MHRHYCEDLADRLAANWDVVRTSTHRGRVRRLADMLHVAWHARTRYAVAHVDVFSGTAFLWAEAVCFELARLHKPIVLTLRGGNLPQFIARWPGRARRLFARAAAITVPTRYLGDAIAPVISRPPIELPNAIDLARYPFAPRARIAPKLVWLRAFHAIYNPVLAIDVLARVREHVDATLEMTGPDKGDGSRAAVDRRIAELGLSRHVTIVPGVPKREVPARLARGEIYLNTADIDNSPITVVEAMACGLCVVTTSAGGMRQLVADGVDARVVPPRDPDAMAAEVLRLIREPAAASAMARAGRARAEACDWPRVLEQWDRVFVQAARGVR